MAETLEKLEGLPHEYVAFDEGRMIYAWEVTMVAMATCAVALRFWARKERSAEFRLDDWLILASLVCLTLSSRRVTG